MKIMDLTPEYEATYLKCFEDWSDEMKEAGNHKCQWYEDMKNKGLKVKIALDEDEKAYGMIQYEPIEYSAADGKDLYFIDCIWVYGYKEGIGNHQKRGTGIALLKAAEDDVREIGAKGLVSWGISMPFWMKASWYKKQDYKKIDKNGMAVLMWKKFEDEAIKPRWIREVKHPKSNENPGKVTVVAFYHSKCQAPLIALERTKRAVASFGDQVVFRQINTYNREVFLEWGIMDGIYVEGKNISNGPPLSYEKIVKSIQKAMKRVR